MMHPSKQSSLSSTNCTFSSKSRFVISTTTTRGRSLTSARLPSRMGLIRNGDHLYLSDYMPRKCGRSAIPCCNASATLCRTSSLRTFWKLRCLLQTHENLQEERIAVLRDSKVSCCKLIGLIAFLQQEALVIERRDEI
eukprot:m.480978 g.480978  ORF g.480978 m.480978 type:complete len:138 (+) comp57180_c0_seq16:1387-1800(+)